MKSAPLAALIMMTMVVTAIAGCSRSRRAPEATAATDDALYLPCAKKSANDFAAGSGSHTFICPAGKLEVGVLASGKTVISYYPTDVSGASAAMLAPSVQAIFPKLGPPSISTAASCRHVIPLLVNATNSSTSQLAEAALTYKAAAELVFQYERGGGSRYAEWTVGGMLLAAQSLVTNENDAARPYTMLTMQSVSDGSASTRPAGPEVAWAATSTCSRTDAPHVSALRTKLMSKGWWFDDADALMNAAKAVGKPDAPETADQVAVIAVLLRQSKDWDAAQQLLASHECLAPKLATAAKGVFAPFDTFSGVDQDFEAVAAPPVARRSGEDGTFAKMGDIKMEVRRFKALIGTPEHARCVLDTLREVQAASNWVKVFGLVGFLEREKISEPVWKGAHGLLMNPTFATELYRALARARADLVQVAGVGGGSVPPTAASAWASGIADAATVTNANCVISSPQPQYKGAYAVVTPELGAPRAGWLARGERLVVLESADGLWYRVRHASLNNGQGWIYRDVARPCTD